MRNLTNSELMAVSGGKVLGGDTPSVMLGWANVGFAFTELSDSTNFHGYELRPDGYRVTDAEAASGYLIDVRQGPFANGGTVGNHYTIAYRYQK